MRFAIIGLVTLACASCFPAKQAPADRPQTALPAPAPLPRPAVVVPETPFAPPQVTSREIAGITFEGVAFNSQTHRLVVADQPAGPGSRHADAASAARALDGIASVNAGFFTPEGTPLGQVVSAGKSSGAWNSASSLGSGIWHETGGRPSIVRREKVGRSSGASELIQAGPMLVENGRAVSGLDSTKTSVRIMILSDGGTRWWIGRASPCSLAALGKALASGRPAGWPIEAALNLDGGRSADLWISSNVSGGPLLRRSPWNRAVRNFLVLRPR